MMQAGVQSYFAINQAQDTIAQKQTNIITNPYMSIGTFSTKMRTDYRYGIATRITPVGMNMDIDRILSQTVNKDNDNKKVIAYNQAMGMLQSLNENAVPEMLMNTKDEKNVEGVSAVKAIRLAMQQGQVLYTINKDNYAKILPKLNHDSETMNDIRNAVNADKVVTIHASAITHLKWHGTGYIITDTATGAGAYMISGGFNGGDIEGINLLSTNFLNFLGYEAMVADNFRNYFHSLAEIVKDTKTMSFLDKVGRFLVPSRFLVNILSTPSDCYHKSIVYVGIITLTAFQLLLEKTIFLMGFTGFGILIAVGMVIIQDILFTYMVNSLISEGCKRRED
ncbi:hypothetical protein [Moraxella macacae]|uniref:hypothetical protein n=1 Tax=Moraxella macacae TaxID=765840 RepID=UPI0003094B09|nr:hypothetical protein [Moraxella macacae]